jgi:hypothetical protein
MGPSRRADTRLGESVCLAWLGVNGMAEHTLSGSVCSLGLEGLVTYGA